MVFITNSTFQDFRAKVNGLGQVFSATFRFLGPSLASNIFAWAIGHDYPFPFNFALPFYVSASNSHSIGPCHLDVLLYSLYTRPA